jgi:hypothetical protein
MIHPGHGTIETPGYSINLEVMRFRKFERASKQVLYTVVDIFSFATNSKKPKERSLNALIERGQDA